MESAKKLLLLSFLSYAIAVEGFECRQKMVQKELYRAIFKVINENAITSSEKSVSNVELLNMGIPLSYSDFNPGRQQINKLPSRILEKGLPFVDKIYPTLSRFSSSLSNFSISNRILKSYHFDSISSVYDYILTHMMLLPQNFSNEEVLRAKYYLQELVPNPERVLRNESQLPRFLLYDYYRSNYIHQKGLKMDAIDKNRTLLSQSSFEKWGQKKLSSLESDTEAAYQKWQAFGYKSEVEKQLQFFEIDTHEDKLMETRALFESMAQPSEKDAHLTIYPYTLQPTNWYKHLKVSLPESVDELRYRKSLLLMQQALLNATKIELNSKTSVEVNKTLNDIKERISSLQNLIENGVQTLLKMEIDCFTKLNYTVCADIIEGHEAFRYILQDVAEHFAQEEYLQSLLNGRSSTLQVLQQKLLKVSSDIKVLSSQISKAEALDSAEVIDTTIKVGPGVANCPGTGQIKFAFDSKSVDEDCDDQNESINCVDVAIPDNSTSKNLWNVHSCSVDSELKSFNLFNNFTHLINSNQIKITASLLKVSVHRAWFDPSIFDIGHYTMKQGSGVVSPGPLHPNIYFQQVAHSGRYLLPHYVSGFILATDIKFFFPGLGSWEYLDDNETNDNIINILMKYAYAPVLTGSVGPFNIELNSGNNHNYQIKRQDGGLLITFPGGQIIAYILRTVQKFPEVQDKPFVNVTQCESDSLLQKKRSKRSVDQELPVNLKLLGKTLFSEDLHHTADHYDLLRDREVISTKYIEQLIRDGNLKQEQLTKFIEKLSQSTRHVSLNISET